MSLHFCSLNGALSHRVKHTVSYNARLWCCGCLGPEYAPKQVHEHVHESIHAHPSRPSFTRWHWKCHFGFKMSILECTRHCPHIFNLVLFGKHICVWVHVIFCEKFNGRGSSTETNLFWSQMSLLSMLRGGACKELIELLHFHMHEQTLLFGWYIYSPWFKRLQWSF